MKRKSFLYLFFGPNGAGKTTLAKEFCLRTKAMHIEIDNFSYMQRGRAWYTRQNSKEKINLLLAVLNEALKNGRTRFSLDGVLIYPFMFQMIEDWCVKNKIEFHPIKVVGDVDTLNFRVTRRIKLRYDWNSRLPEFYRSFHYPGQLCVDTTNVSTSTCFDRIYGLTQKSRLMGVISWDVVSFGMLKPDCLRRNLRIESIRRIEGRGLSILLERQLLLDDRDVAVLYGQLLGKPFFSKMSEFLKSSNVCVFLAQGENTIKTLNSVVGFTDPQFAKVDTLRNLGTSLTENIAHSAPDMKSTIECANHFFGKESLVRVGLGS